MGLCISFKPSVLADFFWHCSSKEWEAVALLVSDHGICPISHLASINPRDIGEVLLLTEGRGWEFSLPNKLSLIFHRLGKCRNASLLLIVWPILMPQSAVWNPWISTAFPLKIHQWEYGVLLLGRGRNIGILPPPLSRDGLVLFLIQDVAFTGISLLGCLTADGMVSTLPAWPLLAWVRIRTFFSPVVFVGGRAVII